jgi:hypothetical protein
MSQEVRVNEGSVGWVRTGQGNRTATVPTVRDLSYPTNQRTNLYGVIKLVNMVMKLAFGGGELPGTVKPFCKEDE